MKFTKLATLALFVLAAPAAMAQSVITVTEAKAFATAPSAMAGGGFMEITNTGTTDDMLIAVEADFPRVAIHTTEFTDGVARMMHVDGIPIPAGETVTLTPGGLHVMFMGLRGDPFEVGEKVDATLIFEVADAVPIIFNVVERDTATHSN